MMAPCFTLRCDDIPLPAGLNGAPCTTRGAPFVFSGSAMPFLVRHYDPIEGHKIVSLSPAPNEVEYPDRRAYKVKTMKDGGSVIQRPMRDGRPRQWVWNNYQKRDESPFHAMWTMLESFDAKARWSRGLAETTVEIWEDVTGTGGFDRLTNTSAPDLVSYSNLQFTRVKFAQVSKSMRKGGGPVTYDAFVEFLIDDPKYDY